MAFEMALKKDKPMIMSDEDVEHYNSMFTACQKRFNNSREASRIIIDGAYMSGISIDLLDHVHGTQMNGCVLDDYASYVEYSVYNAHSLDKYDVVLRVTKFKDGSVNVKLVRP